MKTANGLRLLFREALLRDFVNCIARFTHRRSSLRGCMRGIVSQP